MLKTVLIVFLVMAVLAVGGMAWAKQQGYCSAEGHTRLITERLGRKLDLNDEQQGRLQAFADQWREVRGERSTNRGAIKDRIAGLLSAPALDREQAVALLDERHQAMGDNKRALVDAFGDFSDSLTPDQRASLAELISKRMGHRWGRSHWAH